MLFRQVFDTAAANFKYDGYFAAEGNKEQIDRDNVPFVTTTGNLEGDAIPCMVLFVNKGEQLTKDLMWKTILDRREVAVLNNGIMMGPALYRNALQMLLLDRVFLEEYFGDRINLDARMEGYQLNVTVSNTYPHAVSGKVEVVLPSELKVSGDLKIQVNLPAKSSKTLQFKVQLQPEAMNRTSPV